MSNGTIFAGRIGDGGRAKVEGFLIYHVRRTEDVYWKLDFLLATV